VLGWVGSALTHNSIFEHHSLLLIAWPSVQTEIPEEQQASKTHLLSSLDFNPYNAISTILLTPIMSSAPSGSAHINPMDDETLEPTSVPNPRIRRQAHSSKPLVWYQRQWLGSKPKLLGTRPYRWFWLPKLRTFILQCKLNFEIAQICSIWHS